MKTTWDRPNRMIDEMVPEDGNLRFTAGSKPLGCLAAEVGKQEKIIQSCNDKITIGSWNVISMYHGKLEVEKLEVDCLHINIPRITELKWTRLGHFQSGEHTINWLSSSTRLVWIKYWE